VGKMAEKGQLTSEAYKKRTIKIHLTIKPTSNSCLKWRLFVDVVINLRYNRDLFSPSAAG
jgi:hypothetical protein